MIPRARPNGTAPTMAGTGRRRWGRRSRRDQTLLLLSLLGLTLFAPGAGEAQPWKRNKAYPDGQQVVITGTVQDANGRAIADVDVLLDVSRKTFEFKKMHSVEHNPVTLRTKSDAHGRYQLEWTWHQYYTEFWLRAVVPIGQRGGEREDHAISVVDISDRIREGTPVEVPIPVGDTALLERVRAFEAALVSDDERRVYHDEGLPDRNDLTERRGIAEQTWWYFSIGTLYRFRDDQLVEVENFPPIRE